MNVANALERFRSGFLSVRDKRVLISGAASGIGKATAHLFAREGAWVYITDVDSNGAERTAREIRHAGGQARWRALDVTREDQWGRAIDDIVLEWEGLDVLVANAGINLSQSVTHTTLEDWRRLMEVNVDGVFLGVKHAIWAMRRTGGGSIVVVSSASGVKATPGGAAYAASKAAVSQFAKCAALECARDRDGIRINTIVPGGVETPMWTETDLWKDLASGPHGETLAWRTLASSTPLERFATPGEIARCILFLASDASSYMTGSELVVDGGYTA
jgi:3(or 17)beta-hydroxysteroid dehydrogenase